MIAFIILSIVLSIALCMVLTLILMDQMRMRRSLAREHSKNMMLTVFAHQIRSPLTAIQSYNAGLLGQEFGTLKVGQMEYLKKIDESVSTIMSSVDNFLTLHRLRNNAIVTASTTVDLQETIDRAVTSLKEEWDGRKQKIVPVGKRRTIALHTDMFLLYSMIHAVLLNAIQYSPRSATITVEVSENTHEAIIDIRDTGIGMSDDEQRDVFSLFFRGKRAKGMFTGGSGLGLYLVKNTLDSMGGSVAFASKENEGTTFTLRIPRNSKTEQA